MTASPLNFPEPPAAGARARMIANRSRDTAPELALRRELYRRGLRYRVDAFLRQRVAVLVDGCFWHGCPVHGTTARTNSAYWTHKILTNRLRDVDTNARLAAAGWTVVRVWEHEVKQGTSQIADRIQGLVRGNSGDTSSYLRTPL